MKVIGKIDGKDVPISGIKAEMATNYDQVVKNLEYSKTLDYPEIHTLEEWRAVVPIAIVGGGPSLADNLETLRRFQNVMACGSVHDYLIRNNIVPRWTVLVDADPVMANYLTCATPDTGIYLVSSVCDRSVFDNLIQRKCKIIKWHAGGTFEENTKLFGEKTLVIGGGCTVGTRAMVLASGFGYEHFHLFGFDNCITEKGHHAYEFTDPTKEKIHSIIDIQIGDATFTMADYMVGQLFDFNMVARKIGHKIGIQIHGGGALQAFMDEVNKEKGLEKNGEES